MKISPVIYLDYNATTPVAPEVMNEMLPYFLSHYGNPSSNDHLLGWQAKETMEACRRQLSDSLGTNDCKIIFTAGATESINMVLRGLRQSSKNHIITCKTEHSAMLDTCRTLEGVGFEVTYLDVDQDGIVDIDQLKGSVNERTFMVAIMWVNNETGVIQPIEEIGEFCHQNDLIFLTDATQAIGKIPIDLSNLPVDVILGSAHKIYGPKGVGFLGIRKELAKQLNPQTTGGGQEYSKRAGTSNLPGIVGLSKSSCPGLRFIK